MATISTHTPPGPQTPPDPKEIGAIKDELSDLRTDAGLLRYTTEQRGRIGVTNRASQLGRSLLGLSLLRQRPDLAAFLEKAHPQRWNEVVGLRLALCAARRALAPTLLATEQYDLLVMSELTRGCDRIEDLMAAERSLLSPADRRRMESRLDDPGRIKQLTEEGAEARLKRRGRRSAVAQRELVARKQRLDRVLGRAALSQGALPAR